MRQKLESFSLVYQTSLVSPSKVDTLPLSVTFDLFRVGRIIQKLNHFPLALEL